MKNKFLITLMMIIYIPCALIFMLTWGLICGTLGTMIGVFQDWKKIVVGNYYQWRYMPKTMAYRWWLVKNSVSNASLWEDSAILDEVREGKRPGPSLIGQFIYWTFFYAVFMLPLRLIWGVFSGPIFAGIESVDFFEEKILKNEGGDNEYCI